MPDVKSYGTPTGTDTPGAQGAQRNTVHEASDEQVKAAYQKYMKDVVTAAHNHFHENVTAPRAAARGTSGQQAGANPSQTNRSMPNVDSGVAKAGG